MKRATIEKAVGETPLQAIERFRKDAGIPRGTPLAYAGRLDPMASGKLLVLVGDECKRQREYHSLDKKYEFEVLFGFVSDTGDTLGKAERKGEHTPTEAELRSIAKKLCGNIALPYPVFSSKTVAGKPLFLWTLEGRLNEIEVPTATTKLFSLSVNRSYLLSAADIRISITNRVDRITHVTEESKKLGEDFRRVEILKTWDALLEKAPEERFLVAQFSAVCSSGTYIRSLAPHIASLLGSGGLAYSIHRTKIGRYRTFPFCEGRGLWFPSY